MAGEVGSQGPYPASTGGALTVTRRGEVGKGTEAARAVFLGKLHSGSRAHTQMGGNSTFTISSSAKWGY